jgi:hypothetical protein
LGGLRLLARHPLLERELLELLIIVPFADVDTAAKVGVRASGLRLASLGYVRRSFVPHLSPTSGIASAVTNYA